MIKIKKKIIFFCFCLLTARKSIISTNQINSAIDRYVKEILDNIENFMKNRSGLYIKKINFINIHKYSLELQRNRKKMNENWTTSKNEIKKSLLYNFLDLEDSKWLPLKDA